MKTENMAKSKIKTVVSYTLTFVASILLLVLSFTALMNTQYIGGVTFAVGVTLLVGAIVKLYRKCEKFEGILYFLLKLLFWLP